MNQVREHWVFSFPLGRANEKHGIIECPGAVTALCWSESSQWHVFLWAGYSKDMVLTGLQPALPW